MRLRNDPKELSENILRDELCKINIFDSYYNPNGNSLFEFNIKKNGNDGLIEDRDNNLIWHSTGSKETLDYKMALEWVKELNKDKYRGYTNWRLPSVEEILTLIDRDKNDFGLFVKKQFPGNLDVIWTGDKNNEKGKKPMNWVLLANIKTVRRYFTNDRAFVKPVCGGKHNFQKIEKFAKNIYKNELGFWEAEFDYGISMINIPAGEFIMGEDTELEKMSDHQVYLDSYWIGKYPVTVGQWKLIMKSTIYTDRYLNNDKQIPIVDITWNEIEDFMKNLNKIIDLDFSLPTEAEWEKSARGSDGRKYPWGNMDPDNKLCNFDGFYNKPTQVNKYPKGISPYGLFDMAGNVWEWCWDWYEESIDKSIIKNPKGLMYGSLKVFKGGSFNSDKMYCHSAHRRMLSPYNRYNALGFRLCISEKNNKIIV